MCSQPLSTHTHTQNKNKNKTCTVNAYERVRGVLSQLGERERVGKIVRVLRGKYLIKELILRSNAALFPQVLLRLIS